MKKFLLVALAVIAVVNFVYCTDSEEVLSKVKSKHLKKLLHDRRDQMENVLDKLEEKCSGVKDKLKAAIVSFQECDDKSDDTLTICDAIQRYTLNCTAPLLKVVDDCIPAKAKGLPTLGVKSLLSAADWLCKQSGETIFELFNPCMWEDEDDVITKDHVCEQKAGEIAEKFKDKIPDKTEICSSATGLRTCIQTKANETCKNQKTKNAILGLYDAIVAPCSHINVV